MRLCIILQDSTLAKKYHSAKFRRLPNITEKGGRKRNVFVEKRLPYSSWRLAHHKLGRLNSRRKNVSTTSTAAKWVARFVFVLVVLMCGRLNSLGL